MVVRGDGSAAASLDALKSMPVPSAFGGTVPLSSVADVNIELAPQSIIRVNQSRQLSVTGDTISGDTTAIIYALKVYGGEFFNDRKTVKAEITGTPVAQPQVQIYLPATDSEVGGENGEAKE